MRILGGMTTTVKLETVERLRKQCFEPAIEAAWDHVDMPTEAALVGLAQSAITLCFALDSDLVKAAHWYRAFRDETLKLFTGED